MCTCAQGVGIAGITWSSLGIWDAGWMLRLAVSIDTLAPLLDRTALQSQTAMHFPPGLIAHVTSGWLLVVCGVSGQC